MDGSFIYMLANMCKGIIIDVYKDPHENIFVAFLLYSSSNINTVRGLFADARRL
jgi:hypothetical protein